MTTESSSAAGNDLECVFRLIEQGNSLKDDKKYWEAATAYAQARRKLLQLAHNCETATTPSDKNNDAQIQRLYREQARDYLHRARKALLQGLKEEDEADQQKTADLLPTVVEQIQDEVGAERLRLFAGLFAKETLLNTNNLTINQSTTINQLPSEQPEQAPSSESSLEDRLRNLNANLPSNLKTTDERIRDIHKGLVGLGVSRIEASSTTKPAVLPASNKSLSDVEQVEDIIAQAQDQVRLEQMYTDTAPEKPSSSTSGVSQDEADDLMDNMMDAVAAARNREKGEDDTDDGSASCKDGEEDEPSFASPTFTASDLAYFQDRVNEAQVSLAELNALLDLGDEPDAELLFDVDAGKHALDSAVRYLQQVQKKWKHAKRR